MLARVAGWVILLALNLAPISASAQLAQYQITFKPNGTFEPSQLEVAAGRFRIMLVNESDEAVEFESLRLRQEKGLGPGVTSSIVLTLSRPGNYPFFDDFHPQQQGVLVVLPSP